MLYEDNQLRGPGVSGLPPSPAAVTFVIHGYNVNRKAGVDGIGGFVQAAIEQLPALQETLFVGVLWPGDSRLGFLSYPGEEKDADRTAAALAQVLQATKFSPPPNLVGHSLGCRVVLQTLDLLARTDTNRSWVDQVVLLAAAVDDDALGRADRYLCGVTNSTRLSVVASSADHVLRFAFPAGDWVAGIFTGGYTRKALGYHGPAASPRVPDRVRQVPVGDLGVDHGDYMGGDSKLRRRASAFAGKTIEHETGIPY